MIKKKITHDDIANAIINMNVYLKNCDASTALGFKYSKKKDILKSKKDNSFIKFIYEISKRQNKKI